MVGLGKSGVCRSGIHLFLRVWLLGNIRSKRDLTTSDARAPQEPLASPMRTNVLRIFPVEAMSSAGRRRSKSCLEEAENLRFHQRAHHTLPDIRLV